MLSESSPQYNVGNSFYKKVYSSLLILEFENIALLLHYHVISTFYALTLYVLE